MKVYLLIISLLVMSFISCTKNTGITVTKPESNLILSKMQSGNWANAKVNGNSLNITGVDDYNGKLIQNNVEEAVDAIKYVLEKNIDNQIGQKSYARYRYNFTLDRMWKLYEDLYKILLK